MRIRVFSETVNTDRLKILADNLAEEKYGTDVSISVEVQADCSYLILECTRGMGCVSSFSMALFSNACN